MDPYIEKNMTNYMRELQRIFQGTENEGTGNIPAVAGFTGEQSSSSMESTSPEATVLSSRCPDTPYWTKEPTHKGLADIMPLHLPPCKQPPPGRCITKSTSSTDSASPDSVDLSIIRRPETAFTSTWKPKPFFRKIIKTCDRPFQSPPGQYQVPTTPPKRFQNSFPELNTFPQCSMSPEFHAPTQSLMSPCEFPMYQTFAQSPVSTSTIWSPSAPESCYSLTPHSSMSWHDSYSYTPQRLSSEGPLTDHSNPRYDETWQGGEKFSVVPDGQVLPPFLMTSKFEPPFKQEADSAAFTEPIHQELRVPIDVKTPKKSSKDYCHFCRKNGESPQVYYSHQLKIKKSKRIIIMCPILRSLVCSTCGASGDNAHTSTYCPVVVSSNNGQRQRSATVAVKNTRIKSNGKRRY